MKLPIIHYGDPILRRKADRVEAITDEVRAFIADLLETMQARDGLGIAAPQVGKSLAIFIIAPPIPNEQGKLIQAAPRVFINPKLSNPSQEQWTESEGCMSIPKIYPMVTRPVAITVTAQDIDGHEFTETLVGWPARVLMHENDHINGVLMIDRIPAQERKALEPKLKEIKKRSSTQ